VPSRQGRRRAGRRIRRQRRTDAPFCVPRTQRLKPESATPAVTETPGQTTRLVQSPRCQRSYPASPVSRSRRTRSSPTSGRAPTWTPSLRRFFFRSPVSITRWSAWKTTSCDQTKKSRFTATDKILERISRERDRLAVERDVFPSRNDGPHTDGEPFARRFPVLPSRPDVVQRRH
jgi:hypothetical protein